MTLDELKQENRWLKTENEWLWSVLNSHKLSLPDHVIEREKSVKAQ
ncbi:hypothetical protein K2V14_003954 [Vibrio vulnificus]|nr:hypothetical protein [Vibrio vulnificus]